MLLLFVVGLFNQSSNNFPLIEKKGKKHNFRSLRSFGGKRKHTYIAMLLEIRIHAGRIVFIVNLPETSECPQSKTNKLIKQTCGLDMRCVQIKTVSCK